jgi:hypothetical protein
VPPEYLRIFLADPDLVDRFLGEYEEEGNSEVNTEELLRQLGEDPDVMAVLAAADLATA